MRLSLFLAVLLGLESYVFGQYGRLEEFGGGSAYRGSDQERVGRRNYGGNGGYGGGYEGRPRAAPGGPPRPPPGPSPYARSPSSPGGRSTSVVFPQGHGFGLDLARQPGTGYGRSPARAYPGEGYAEGPPRSSGYGRSPSRGYPGEEYGTGPARPSYRRSVAGIYPGESYGAPSARGPPPPGPANYGRSPARLYGGESYGAGPARGGYRDAYEGGPARGGYLRDAGEYVNGLGVRRGEEYRIPSRGF